jgi:hypothetical protein
VSKRTGTSNRIEIQFRTFNHLSHPDSFAKLFETLCLCLPQGNEYLGQIWDRNLMLLMRYIVILNQKWISILQLVPGLFRDHLAGMPYRGVYSSMNFDSFPPPPPPLLFRFDSFPHIFTTSASKACI